MKRCFLSLLGLVFGYIIYQIKSPEVLAAYGEGFQNWIDPLFAASVLLLIGGYFGLSILDHRYQPIYTDGTHVVSTSAEALQWFMEQCQLSHLPFNSASFVNYYVVEKEHLPVILNNGAELLTGYQLNNLIATVKLSANL
ncbi:MAG: hypothetical protein ACFB15_09180 [Cyclobacteriaceae bacterium]